MRQSNSIESELMTNTATPKQPMTPTTKIVLAVIVGLMLIGMIMNAGSKSSFCNAHRDGRGFKTLDEKYKWVMECNDGKPAPVPSRTR